MNAYLPIGYINKEPYPLKNMINSIKLGVSVTGVLFGTSSATMGAVMANVPSLSESTPVALGIMFAGIGLAAALSWRISGAWNRLEVRLTNMDAKMEALKSDLRDSVDSAADKLSKHTRECAAVRELAAENERLRKQLTGE